MEVTKDAYPLPDILKLHSPSLAPYSQQLPVMDQKNGKTVVPFLFPRKIEIRKDDFKTLNDFQRLLGNIQWLRSYLRFPTDSRVTRASE